MRPEHPHRYPDIDEHLVPGPESGGSIREMSRSSTLWTNEASIYCSSIKQRERKYFRQLIFCSQDLWASLRGSACLHDHSTSCQNRSTPYFNELILVNSQLTTINCLCLFFETNKNDSKEFAKIQLFSIDRLTINTVYNLYETKKDAPNFWDVFVETAGVEPATPCL